MRLGTTFAPVMLKMKYFIVLIAIIQPMLSVGQRIKTDLTKNIPKELDIYAGGKIQNEIIVSEKASLIVPDKYNKPSTIKLIKVKPGVYELSFIDFSSVQLIYVKGGMRQTIDINKHQVDMRPQLELITAKNDTLDKKSITDSFQLELKISFKDYGGKREEIEKYRQLYLIQKFSLNFIVNGNAYVLDANGASLRLDKKFIDLLRQTKHFQLTQGTISHPTEGQLRIGPKVIYLR